MWKGSSWTQTRSRHSPCTFEFDSTPCSIPSSMRGMQPHACGLIPLDCCVCSAQEKLHGALNGKQVGSARPECAPRQRGPLLFDICMFSNVHGFQSLPICYAFFARVRIHIAGLLYVCTMLWVGSRAQ